MIVVWSVLLLACASPSPAAPVATPNATPPPAPPIVWPESNVVQHNDHWCTWQGIELHIEPPAWVGCSPRVATASFEQATTNEEARAWAVNLLEAQGFTLVARPRDQRGWVQDPYYARGDLGVEVILYRGNAADGGPVQVLLGWRYKGERLPKNK
jgi:hypothetical protein